MEKLADWEVKVPFDFNVIDSSGYLHVEVTGIIGSTEELLEYTKTVIAASKQYGCRCVLLDERDLSGSFDIVSIVNFVEMMREQGFHKIQLRTAVLKSASKKTIVSDDFELILRNRAFQYQIFMDLAAAQAWLAKADCRSLVGSNEGAVA